MKVQFLLDENLSPDIVSAVLRHDHTVAILRVGQQVRLPLARLMRRSFCTVRQRSGCS